MRLLALEDRRENITGAEVIIYIQVSRNGLILEYRCFVIIVMSIILLLFVVVIIILHTKRKVL